MVNIAAMLQDAEAIKQSRQATKMNDLELQSAQAGIERQGRLQDLIPSAVSGNQQALNNVASIDPDSAIQIQDYLGNVSDQEKAEIAERTRATGQLALFVKQSPDKANAYNQALQQAQQMGIDVSSFPPQYSPEVDQMLDMAIAQSREIEDMLKPTKEQNAGSAVGKIQQDLKRGLITEEQAQQQIENLNKKAGTSLVTVNNNPNPDLSKGTIGAIEKKSFEAVGALERLNSVSETFRPEFLEVGSKAGFAFDALREKAGADLSEDERNNLIEFSQFKQRAMNNLSQVLKEMSGAAINESEMRRLTQSLPNPGEGIIDGDSPSQFKAKLDVVLKDTKRAIIRYNYAIRNNLDPQESGIDLADVDVLINKRGEELEALIRQENPNMSDDIVDLEVGARLKNEFGL